MQHRLRLTDSSFAWPPWTRALCGRARAAQHLHRRCTSPGHKSGSAVTLCQAGKLAAADVRRDKLPARPSCGARASRRAAHSLDSLCTDSSSARPRRACAGDARRGLRLLPPAPAQVCRRRPSAADSSGAPPATARACRHAARHMPAQPGSAATAWPSAPPYKCCLVQSTSHCHSLATVSVQQRCLLCFFFTLLGNQASALGSLSTPGRASVKG